MIAVLLGFRELARDVRHFDFEAENAGRLSFAPGQFVSLSHAVGPRVITRAYSIASPPDGNRFSLCLNRVEDGLLSPYLFSLEPGNRIDIRGPLGTFTIRHPDRDKIFVATGTGIAPFRSMAHAQLAGPGPARLTLVFGTRYEETLLYRDEWDRLASAGQRFTFWPTLSRPAASWRGRTGHVQAHALEAIGERRDVDVYICGLKAMVDDLRARLKGIGLDRKQIIYERYD